MKQPVISVIIPLFNGIDLTRTCLDSLDANTDSALYKLVLVDNASSDATTLLLDALPPSVTIIRNATNLGFGRACNQGAWAADTPYLLFLNNDTAVTRGWLEAMIEACEEDVGAVGCRMLYLDGTIQHAGVELIDSIPEHPYRHLPGDLPEANIPRDLDMVSGACLLIRRELFLPLGGFDESYRNGLEDADLCLRVREAGYRIVYQPRAMIYHYEGQSPGRFDHVDQNDRFFIKRWQGRFSEGGRLMATTPHLIFKTEKSYINEQRLYIVWQGSQFVYHSLALVNRELCRRLMHLGHELSIAPYEPDEFVPEPDSPLAVIQRCVNKPLAQQVDAVIRHQWPPDFTPPPAGHFVMIQPWEFGSIPISWVEPINSIVDEVWAYTSYVRDCYVESGVNPDKVHIVPLGVDTAIYLPGTACLRLPTHKSFRFLFVGGTIHRKGIDLLLAAYRQTFTAHDDVCLVIKDMGGKSFYQGQTAQEMIQRFSVDPTAPEIVYIDSNLNQEEMAALYRSCHCLVHPYRGEGFGLPIAEAMASGLPVIVTGLGSATDFCPPDIAWLIPAEARQFSTSRVGDIDTVGLPWLAEPDLTILGKLMRHASNNPDEARRRGQAACEHIRKHFTWDHAARCVEARLQKLRTKPIVRFSNEKYSTRVAENADRLSDGEARGRDQAVMVIKQAQILHLHGETDAAVTMLIQQGIGIAPEWPAPYVALAELLMREQRFADALQVVQEMPSASELAVNKEIEAICHLALGNDEAAIQAAGQSKKRPRSLVAFGTLAARHGNIAEAEASFRRAIEADSSCSSAWLSLGMLQWGNADQEDAYQAVRQAVTVDPLNDEAVKILRDMAERKGSYADVLQIVFEAVQRYPDSLNMGRHHAELLAKCGREQEALGACEALLAKLGVDEAVLALALQLRRSTGVHDHLADSGVQSISLCMIVKNEEKNLPACLASLKPVVDEMIVVDTGSIDRSADIAAAFGARVCNFSWNGNFSDARNYSIAQAKGAWVLVMDADEVLSAQDYRLLRQTVSDSIQNNICWSVLTRNYTRLHPEGWIANDGMYACEERAEGWHPSSKIRLFPNNPTLRFVGEVHEMIEQAAKSAGYLLRDALFVVHHYGGLADSVAGDQAKKEVYYELGRLKLTEHPDDLPAIGELAVQAAELERYEEAIELWNRFLELAPDAAVALFNKGFALMRLNHFAEALDVTRRTLEIEPYHKEAAFNYGVCSLYAGDQHKAINRLELILRKHHGHPPMLAILTLLLLVSGQREKAIFTYSELKALNYAITDFAKARAEVLIKLGKDDMARILLEECEAIGILNNAGVQ